MKLLLDLQLLQQHEGKNGSLKLEREGNYLVAGPKDLPWVKREEPGMV